MSAKTNTEAKVPVLKGQEGTMNRPFGAVDVAANLKGAVPKTATQKILVTLAEKGELIQKTYGKTTFFVANQANLEDMPAEKLKTLEIEYKAVEETNKALLADVKAASAGIDPDSTSPLFLSYRDLRAGEAEIYTDGRTNLLANGRDYCYGTKCSRVHFSLPSDHPRNWRLSSQIAKAIAHLQPLRSGSPLVSAEELARLDAEWLKWRAEWIRRRKIFNDFWALAIDALPPQDASELAEDLGIEFDTEEHRYLEKGPLCVSGSILGKRRR
ncbi:hypothetical protein PHLCEN_2v10443 [Hermanssonia centrifuga]|uniref:Homologous-pairing protein 2 winged helix domain-containing protein n=1 Tax=Hermanssonia centrifuga TaxID=98765 RepID=A0A2R6NMW2_9APHY|nr:hypothetical protein PHLCEN_2v10443 [Hermanssonia centrifuga]